MNTCNLDLGSQGLNESLERIRDGIKRREEKKQYAIAQSQASFERAEKEARLRDAREREVDCWVENDHTLVIDGHRWTPEEVRKQNVIAQMVPPGDDD